MKSLLIGTCLGLLSLYPARLISQLVMSKRFRVVVGITTKRCHFTNFNSQAVRPVSHNDWGGNNITILNYWRKGLEPNVTYFRPINKTNLHCRVLATTPINITTIIEKIRKIHNSTKIYK